MGLAKLNSAGPSIGFNYNALGLAIGSALQQPSYIGSSILTSALTLGTGANQINLIAATISAITASGSVTLNLNSITDIRGQTVNFTRVKGWLIWNLSLTDDAVNGGNASSILIGNAATPFPFNLTTAAGTWSQVNGEAQARHAPAAAGILTAGQNNVKIVNSDGVNGAGVLTLFWGSDA